MKLPHLIVECIPSTDATLWSYNSSSERAEADKFCNYARRTEWLAWRAVVRRELGMGVEIEYSMLGVPQVSGGVEVSVSHCRGMVAVLFSEERCGVDVELLERDFERTAKRWISGPERALSDNKNFLAIVWSAKEAMYKLLGRREVSFLVDMRAVSVDFDLQTIEIRAFDKSYIVHFQTIDNCIVSWIF